MTRRPNEALAPGATDRCTKLWLAQTWVSTFGFLTVHLWTTRIAYEHGGLGRAVLHFFLFIYAELYWAWRTWREEGLNLYSLLAGGWALVYIALVLLFLGCRAVSKRSQRRSTAGD